MFRSALTQRRCIVHAVAELELSGYAGNIGKAGKRPRFRLSSRQTRLAAYLPEIEAALQTIGEGPAWLHRRNRSVPFSGRTPLKLMVEPEGVGAAQARGQRPAGGV
jgi:hypothetical protein